MSEKNLPPTPQRLRQARERGQIGVSQDLVKLLRFAVIAELVFLANDMLQVWIGQSFTAATQNLNASWREQFDAILHAVTPMLTFMLALAFIAAVLGYLATLLQTGFNLALQSFENGLTRLNPVSNVRQIFSLQKLSMLLLGLLKVSLVLWVGYVCVMSQLPLMLRAYQYSALDLWSVCSVLLQQIERVCLLVLIALALLDVALQRWLTYRKLKMSIDEVKRDYKESEGDPHVKAHRVNEGKQMLNEPFAPKARPSVVVVNPEHIAIALAYEFAPGTLPTIAAKAQGEDAQYMRDRAMAQGIPVIRYVGLARQLYAVGKTDRFVPRELLAATALIFRAVQELREARRYGGGVAKVSTIHEMDEALGERMLSQRSLAVASPVTGTL